MPKVTQPISTGARIQAQVDLITRLHLCLYLRPSLSANAVQPPPPPRHTQAQVSWPSLPSMLCSPQSGGTHPPVGVFGPGCGLLWQALFAPSFQTPVSAQLMLFLFFDWSLIIKHDALLPSSGLPLPLPTHPRVPGMDSAKPSQAPGPAGRRGSPARGSACGVWGCGCGLWGRKKGDRISHLGRPVGLHGEHVEYGQKVKARRRLHGGEWGREQPNHTPAGSTADIRTQAQGPLAGSQRL